MYRSLLVSFALVLMYNLSPVFSQNNSVNDRVLATVGKEKITYGELERAFQKNLNRKNTSLSSISRDSLMDFLNLYINFKLKVIDAIDRGFDKDTSVIADLAQNRKVLAESFFYDKNMIEPNVNKYLKMREKEYKVAIILSTYMQGNVKDTAEAFQKINQAMNELKNGADFAKVADEFSDDRESAGRGGIIHTWITAGKVQRVLENAIYATKIGEIHPNIIHTRFGFFIVKVIDIQDRVRIMPSHILFTFNEEKRDSLATEKKADSVLALLKRGAEFKKMAKENSDDPLSAKNGGTLGSYYSRSTGLEGSGTSLVPEFEEALFKLKDNQFSEKIRSEFGIHIIRRDETASFDIETEKDELKKMYKRLYYVDDRWYLIDTAAKSLGFELNENTLNTFLSYLDTSKTSMETTWADAVKKDSYNKVLYKFQNNTVDVEQFIKDVNTKTELKGIALNREGITLGIKRVIEPVVFNNLSKNLEKDHPDFAALMREFRDGILLFKIEAMEVWDKLKFDTVEARKYYESNKSKFFTDVMTEVTEVHLFNDSIANEVYKRVKAGENIENIAEIETQRSGYREKKGKWDAVSTKSHKIGKLVIENSANEGDVFGPVKVDNGYSIIKVNKIIQPKQKTFEQAIPDFASTLQDLTQKKLTNNWLDSIKKKHTVKIDQKVINEINKNK